MHGKESTTKKSVSLNFIHHHNILYQQTALGGPAVSCCIRDLGSCGGPAGICTHFYDSAPSGRYGTLSYLAQSVANQLKGLHAPSDDCKIS